MQSEYLMLFKMCPLKYVLLTMFGSFAFPIHTLIIFDTLIWNSVYLAAVQHVSIPTFNNHWVLKYSVYFLIEKMLTEQYIKQYEEIMREIQRKENNLEINQLLKIFF